MEERSQIEVTLRKLFAAQRLAVLSTQGDGRPYGSLVAFCSSDDLRRLVFATTRNTRKFGYLSAHPWVALVVDSRSNRESDFHEAIAVTATGRSREASGDERSRLAERYLAKHPALGGFVASPTCAIVVVDVTTYYLVSRFQHVVELHMEPAP
jgi:nitroimidazol reductase NimA-like FMN-containing flavoprotein (pyridoxamine 5'-phosphate oxidase superfamily)